MNGLVDQLYQMYTAEIYPVLANNDPEYQRVLASAGLSFTAKTVPPAKQKLFEETMRVQAWLAVRKLEDAKVLNWPASAPKFSPVRRLSSASRRKDQSPAGIWWFTEKVAQRCRDEAGMDGTKQLDWLRNVLAVCYNWSNFDLLQRLALHSGERIPAILGIGLPMPYHKVTTSTERPANKWWIGRTIRRCTGSRRGRCWWVASYRRCCRGFPCIGWRRRRNSSAPAGYWSWTRSDDLWSITAGPMRSCLPRQKSMYEIWCTQATVQRGAQPLAVRYSRWISARVYSSSGLPG